jgi:ABC-2 type transport system permease protein
MRRFFSQAWLNFKAHQAVFNLEEFLAFQTAYPLLTLIFYCVLAGYSFRTQDLTRWVIGNSFLLCVNTCIFGLGTAFTGERVYGRLRSIIVSPSNKLALVLQSGFFPALMAAVTVIIGFFAGSLIFGVDFAGIDLGLFILISLVSMFAATGFGLFLSSFGLLTPNMNFVLNLISYVLMIFCGANFPIEQLPKAVRLISQLIPLTRGIEAAGMLFEGMDKARLFVLLLGEAGTGAVYFVLAFFVIRIAERLAIRKATLEMF